MIHVINIVDSLLKVNYGIWNAAIATTSYLEEHYDVKAECWHLPTDSDETLPSNVKTYAMESEDLTNLNQLIKNKSLSPHNTIIITHGCWRFPSRIGSEFAAKGYNWIYVPHGMLEPWSLAQKRLKKIIYFHLIEKHLIHKAIAIRAVGTPEFENLSARFGIRTTLIPNGIPEEKISKPKTTINTFLFMARLHHKKGIIPLTQAWLKSNMNNHPNYELIIAGPDDGELAPLTKLLKSSKSQNIKYVGAIYNNEKRETLLKSRFYILPSHSEGFPTSVLEAMQFGLIPIITDGCNFPEAFENDAAIKTETDQHIIEQTLNDIYKTDEKTLLKYASKAQNLVRQNYSIKSIAGQQYQLYTTLLNQ